MKRTLLTRLCLLLTLLFALPLQSVVSHPKHIEIARSFIGIKEVGNNRGAWVDRWNSYVGNPKGSPYCAAVVSFVKDCADANYPKIKTGLATRFITKESVQAIDVFKGKKQAPEYSIVIWQRGATIFGHAGFLENILGKNKFQTLEGNTSSGRKGSQHDGNGFYRRTRTIEPYNYFRIKAFTPVRYS